MAPISKSRRRRGLTQQVEAAEKKYYFEDYQEDQALLCVCVLTPPSHRLELQGPGAGGVRTHTQERLIFLMILEILPLGRDRRCDDHQPPSSRSPGPEPQSSARPGAPVFRF